MKIFVISFLTILLGFNSAWSYNSAPKSTTNSLYPISDKILWLGGITLSHSRNAGTKAVLACLETPNDNPLCRLTNELKNSFHQSDDISPLLNSKVLYVGEKHIVSDARLFIMRYLKQLRKNGFTTLAMEMWNSSAQADIDTHVNSNFNLNWIEQNFSKHWSYEPNTYLELMIEAHKLGFRILALDSRDKFDTNSLSFAEGILLRDIEMAKVIAHDLRMNPQQKIIALTGKFHAYSHISDQDEQSSQAQLLLQQVQVPVSTVIVINKKDVSPLGFVANVLNYSNILIKTQPSLHYSDYLYVQDQSSNP